VGALYTRFVVACGGAPYFGALGAGFTRDRSHLEADASSKTVKHLMLASSGYADHLCRFPGMKRA
jgi:hypothetical protein